MAELVRGIVPGAVSIHHKSPNIFTPVSNRPLGSFATGAKVLAMSISVIIVSWNAKAFLLKCLESVFHQRVTGSDEPEVIVVDNASTDGSPEAVEAAFPRVKVIRNGANYGFAKANNVGVRASSGDYLFLINSDVVVGDDCFGRMVQYMG